MRLTSTYFKIRGFLQVSKKRYKVIFVFLFVITVISLSKPILGYEETPETIPISVNMKEFSSHKGEIFDISSIDITFPQWNLTSIEMKITNIRSDNEVNSIVNSSNNQEKLSSKIGDNNALAVQLNVTEPIILNSIFIYGKAVGSELEPVYLQIEGYDSNTHCPNSSIYGGPIEVNMAGNEWYEQKFPTPINLSKGKYFIVLDARSASADTANYYWSYHEMPQLYSAYYDNTTGWESYGSNSPFSYKLNFSYNKPYLPEDIDAHIEFNCVFYPINNSGIKILNELNYKITSGQFHANFAHNSSHQLIFNLEYDVNLSNTFKAPGTLELSNFQSNQWFITPYFSRCGYDYSVVFEIPTNWFDIIVHENEIDVSSKVLIEDHLIQISNSSIDITDTWEIMALSPSTYCDMQYPDEEWESGQQVEFFISTPSISGNITFKLVDKNQYICHSETKAVLSSSTRFSYTNTPDTLSGMYEAVFIWQNGTDASYQTHSFYLNGFQTPPSIPYLQITVIIGIISVIMGSMIYTIIKIKDDYSRKGKSARTMYEDLFHLKYIIVGQKTSGLNVYEHFITGDRGNSSLVSSYLSAINDLGIELFEINKEIPLIKIEFEDFFLFIINAQNSRTYFTMSKNPGEEFLRAMKTIVQDIESVYGSQIKGFNGWRENFEGIEDIIETYFPLSLLRPLKLTSVKDPNLSSNEIKIIKKARKIASLQEENLVNARYLLTKNIKKEEIALITKLIQKGIFLPINNN